MLAVERTNRFKKDVKLMLKRGKKIEELKKIVTSLIARNDKKVTQNLRFFEDFLDFFQFFSRFLFFSGVNNAVFLHFLLIFSRKSGKKRDFFRIFWILRLSEKIFSKNRHRKMFPRKFRKKLTSFFEDFFQFFSKFSVFLGNVDFNKHFK